MQSILNWSKLYSEGRCKDIGVPFSEEELKAKNELRIPVEYVRQGIVTIEDYESELQKEVKDGKSLDKESIERIREIAKEHGIVVTPDASKSILLKEIELKKNQKKQAAIQAKALIEAREKFEKEEINEIVEKDEKISKAKAETKEKEIKK